MKFGHRFATISQDAWWKGDSINYKELKKMLKGVEAGDQSETEGTFLANLLREVQKANSFFVTTEARFESEFEDLLAKRDTLAAQLASLLRTPELRTCARISRQSVVAKLRGCTPDEDAAAPAAAPAEAAEADADASELGAFFALSDDLDSLRKFAFLNFLAVTKILKKHDKNSTLHLRDSLVAYVEKQPIYTSSQLGRIWARAHVLLNDLFANVPGCELCENEAACGICRCTLSDPTVLSCSHRFCAECLGQAAQQYHRCPICEAGIDLENIFNGGGGGSNENSRGFAAGAPVEPAEQGALVPEVDVGDVRQAEAWPPADEGPVLRFPVPLRAGAASELSLLIVGAAASAASLRVCGPCTAESVPGEGAGAGAQQTQPRGEAASGGLGALSASLSAALSVKMDVPICLATTSPGAASHFAAGAQPQPQHQPQHQRPPAGPSARPMLPSAPQPSPLCPSTSEPRALSCLLNPTGNTKHKKILNKKIKA